MKNITFYLKVLVLLVFFLNACTNDQKDEPQKHPQKEPAAKEQQAVFNSLKACLQAKKKEAGVKAPTAEMIKACSSTAP